MKTLEQGRDSRDADDSFDRAVGRESSSLVSSKVSTQHLARRAVVYVRQSSVRQVRENTESTQLQYNLASRAKIYGWPSDRIEVIDDDLGVSGKTLEGRIGFQRLLAEISLGHVGIVMGIEMSRLARNCRDWHQLLELCAVFGSLLGDADGIYDPRDHNDRLLLGLKGTMSEAELHVLRSRLHAGKKNKARRGEHFSSAPIGYVRTHDGLVIDPDTQARSVIELVFQKFNELGSAHAVLRFMHDESILIGRRKRNGLQPSPLTWQAPNRSTINYILRHPVYAGAYVYGRTRYATTSDASGGLKARQTRVPQDEWEVLLRDHLPAYIGWDQWEANQEKLRENSTRFGFGAPGGASLIAGRVYCGKCGSRIPVKYVDGMASFGCTIARMQFGDSLCQSFSARWLEPMVESLVLKALSPASISLSLDAATDIESDRVRLEQNHQHAAQRARYQADLAQRRFEEVDPSNRLVAAELEKRWELALTEQRKCEESLNRFRVDRPSEITADERSAIKSLASDIDVLWRSQSTTQKDRQELVRLLVKRIEVEVLDASERLSVTIHWAGGFTSSHESRRTVATFDELEGSESLYARGIELYNSGCTRHELVAMLNKEGFRPARKESFTMSSINALLLVLRRKKLIGSRPDVSEPYWRSGKLAAVVGIKTSTLSGWRRRGWVQSVKRGRRWIYWASGAELTRLKKLSAYPSRCNGSTPASLTQPVEKRPKS